MCGKKVLIWPKCVCIKHYVIDLDKLSAQKLSKKSLNKYNDEQSSIPSRHCAIYVSLNLVLKTGIHF